MKTGSILQKMNIIGMKQKCNNTALYNQINLEP